MSGEFMAEEQKARMQAIKDSEFRAANDDGEPATDLAGVGPRSLSPPEVVRKTLRERVIEAMMHAEESAGFVTDPTASAIALDALLDTLAENADEWVESTDTLGLDDAMERGDHKLADVLLAVLRGGEDRP